MQTNILSIITGPVLPMCPKAPENLKGKVNISLEERKMEDIENDLGEIFNKKYSPQVAM